MQDLRDAIDPDITIARTLPSRVYSDPAIFARLRDNLFTRSWQLAADIEAVRIPQQVHPFAFMEGFIDEPLLLTRDSDDHLHCLSNVCTHRGTIVVPEPCKSAHLRCPYHGRRFGLDGRFQHMPEFEQAKNFPADADNLPRVPFTQWGKWIFVSLDPAFAFDELIRNMQARIGWMPLEEFVHDPSRSRDYLVRANWALYVENYLEGFHIPFVHAGLNAVIDYNAYQTDLFSYGNVQVGVAKGGEDVFDLPRSSPDHGQRIAAYYFWLLPNIMFNFYPWGLSINVVRPLQVGLTKVSFISYVWKPDRLDRGAGAGLDRVEREDEAVVESVQRGMQSRLYDRGRYSPTRERGVHLFHRLLCEFAGD
jgi:choline monooxygenase